ncbi:MAG: cytidine deaminase [Actinobacteria bacterium]|nr:cytidine deaminase [Actinomycetota bacterium]
MKDIELVKMALEARERAYAPYSRFLVGAALMTNDGKAFTGCNVENVSYGLTICAERAAVFMAVREVGPTLKIKKIAVVGERKGAKSAASKDIAAPCGACRQVLSEFSDDMEVIVSDINCNYKKYSLDELLPHAFKKI